MHKLHKDDPRLTAYALGELAGAEKLAVEAALAQDPALRQELDALRDFSQLMTDAYGAEESEGLPDAQKQQLREQAQAPRRLWLRPGFMVALASVAAVLVFAFVGLDKSAVPAAETNPPQRVLDHKPKPATQTPVPAPAEDKDDVSPVGQVGFREKNADVSGVVQTVGVSVIESKPAPSEMLGVSAPQEVEVVAKLSGELHDEMNDELLVTANLPVIGEDSARADAAQPTAVKVGETSSNAAGDKPRRPLAEMYSEMGIARENVPEIDFSKKPIGRAVGFFEENKLETVEWAIGIPHSKPEVADGNSFKHIVGHKFINVVDDPRSTFSIDVDTAAYAVVRKYLNEGKLPPQDAVRIEELLNYFNYEDQEPTDGKPFAVATQLGRAPWNPQNHLLRVGIKARSLFDGARKACNLVFLVDVSGSMNSPNKLDLVKSSLILLAQNLDERDKVSIVVYAGASGIVLPPTRGDDFHSIEAALNKLFAGGGTNGQAGIEAAYSLAKQNFVTDGINRVILATDGDFNVGARDESALVRLIEEKRKSGIFLTVLGYGMDNLKDDKLELLSSKGNGNYAYIGSEDEAYKVMTDEVGGTIFTVARDVKIQLEMNPAHIKAWRLIGYENRVLAHTDFNDDTKDAGEIGAGHSIVALYELIGVDGEASPALTDTLKYQQENGLSAASKSGEWLTVNLRYKPMDDEQSRLIEVPVRPAATPAMDTDFNFAAAVTAFAHKLRKEPLGKQSWDEILQLAQDNLGPDLPGYRQEFTELVRKASELMPDQQ